LLRLCNTILVSRFVDRVHRAKPRWQRWTLQGAQGLWCARQHARAWDRTRARLLRGQHPRQGAPTGREPLWLQALLHPSPSPLVVGPLHLALPSSLLLLLLLQVGNPTFMGFCAQRGAPAGALVVPKNKPTEKVALKAAPVVDFCWC
jgi:hypothetical protein